jgi:hypothetical protein
MKSSIDDELGFELAELSRDEPQQAHKQRQLAAGRLGRLGGLAKIQIMKVTC